MNVYGFHTIESGEVKRLISVVTGFFISELTDLLSINLIGSSVKEIINSSQFPDSDLDFAVLKEEEFDYKKINVDLVKLDQLLKKEGFSININYNGLRRVNNQSQKSIDIILQSLNELLEEEPHVVFDVAKRNRVHVHGRDFYKNLEKNEMSYDILIDRIKMTRNYISRESAGGNMQNDWPRYIAKSAILNTSYLFIDHYNTVSKEAIYEYTKQNYPLILDDMEFLFQVYTGDIKINLEKMIDFNIQYGDKLLRTYKLTNL